MIRVIHISDFHFDTSTLGDWENYTRKALLETVCGQQQQIAISDTFVICSGDMINKGGKTYKGVVAALTQFNEKVILPVLESTGLSKDHFILVPGNHEIDRNADEDTHAEGLRTMIAKQGATRINAYTEAILSGNYKDSNRIREYNGFVAGFYQGFDNVFLSPLGAAFTFDTTEGRLGIAAFNTVWNAYDKDDYERGLAIGEPQYRFCKERLAECDIRIATMHHPLEWMKFEKRTIQNWVYSDFQFVYVGHVHESESYYKSTIAGSLLVNVAPSYTTEIRSTLCGALTNGFSFVDYTHASRAFSCRYYKYGLSERKYVPNTDICEDGVYQDTLPKAVPGSLAEIQRHAIDYISAVKVAAFNNSIIPMKAHAISTLKDAFVKPPLYKYPDPDRKDYEMTELLSSKSHLLLLGTSESGKTVMLYRLLMETVGDFAKYGAVPVYVDFNTIGNRDMESIVREFIDVNSAQTHELLQNGKVLLFLDNYNPKQDTRHVANGVYRFTCDYNVRVIATADCQSEGLLPGSFISGPNEIPFEYFFISRFSSDRVRQMMVKWSPNDEFLERNAKLEKMVSSFCNYSLPCTAMSVSLYLWSTERADREPVNEAVLLDIYIEIILEKLNLDNAYQNSFDYKNKTMLLAYLAERVREKSPVDLTYGEYIDHISRYLKEAVGFEKFDPKKIGDYFIERKLFTRVNDEVHFAHTCFYYFFLAQRMKDSEEFRAGILTPNNYYKNDRAVSYYAGLVRNDKSLLQFLLKDVNRYFEPAQEIYDGVNVDDCFTYLYEGEKTYKSVVRSGVTQRVLDNKPSKEEVEKKLIQRCDEQLSKISDEIRSHEYKTPDLLIAMLADALKNLDGIEDMALKNSVYDAIIRDGIIFLVVTKETLADYANHHEGQLPFQFWDVKNVPMFFRFMPYAFQHYLYTVMGTTKLSMTFRDKFVKDMKRSCSDIERFMTAGMMWDCINLGSYDEMKRFIKKVGKNVAKDYIFFKLLHHYNYRVLSGTEEERQYIQLFSALEARNKFLPFVEQKKIEQRVLPKKK